jgi:hypothetical protein
MRISRATDSAEKKTDPAKELSLAPWMHGDPLEHSNPVVKRDNILVFDYSIKYESRSAGEKEAFIEYREQLSKESLSGELIKNVFAKLQGISWKDLPNPQGTLVRVLLPEGVTLPNTISSSEPSRPSGMPS